MSNSTGVAIQSTAGAVPVRNQKGDLSMQKVKVHRYVSGKRPEYAPSTSSEEMSEGEDLVRKRPPQVETTEEVGDARLRRLKLGPSDAVARRPTHSPTLVDTSDHDDTVVESEEELSEGELERRRQALRDRILSSRNAADQDLPQQDEDSDSSEDSDTGCSEETDSSNVEEETRTRLKPVFVNRKDRVTVLEREREALRKKEREVDARKAAEERRLQTLRMVQDDVASRRQAVDAGSETIPAAAALHAVDTDDDNDDEEEYEAWKLRELRRVKRDREEREQVQRERLDVERLRALTPEERRHELRLNPRVVSNKAAKGKYKFLQKYFHRGAFFMDREQDLYKRDFSAATLEDHFDKTVLPKVMQVKNFGRSGRTKYTHLVDQDTTQFDSPWVSDFKASSVPLGKQLFCRPSQNRRKAVAQAGRWRLSSSIQYLRFSQHFCAVRIVPSVSILLNHNSYFVPPGKPVRTQIITLLLQINLSCIWLFLGNVHQFLC